MLSLAAKIRAGLSLKEAMATDIVQPPYIPDLGDEDGDEYLLEDEAEDDDAAE
jgi:hypothetical protein